MTGKEKTLLGDLGGTFSGARVRKARARARARARAPARSLALAILLAACGDPQGVDTGSTCPPIDPPTYASFGQAFFTAYCNNCHSQTLSGDARNGAPVTIDFDTRSLVRMSTSNIDKQAAFGPNARNTLMPPDDADAVPSDDERRLLGEYIACEIGR